MKTFNQYQKFNDESDYEDIYEDVEHEYEVIAEKPDPKEEKKRLKEQQAKERAEKKRLEKESKAEKKRNKNGQFSKFKLFWLNKTREKQKLTIGSPEPDTFEHVCHAGFNSNGFVIEGMDLKVFQKLIEDAGISHDNVSHVFLLMSTYKNISFLVQTTQDVHQ